MSTPKDTGGAAFPAAIRDDYFGMTMRDYFAAKALSGLLANSKLDFVRVVKKHQEVLDILAEVSMKLADAMLAERSKP